MNEIEALIKQVKAVGARRKYRYPIKTGHKKMPIRTWQEILDNKLVCSDDFTRG